MHMYTHQCWTSCLMHGVSVCAGVHNALTHNDPYCVPGLVPRISPCSFLVCTDGAEETRPLLILYKVLLGRAFDALYCGSHKLKLLCICTVNYS